MSKRQGAVCPSARERAEALRSIDGSDAWYRSRLADLSCAIASPSNPKPGRETAMTDADIHDLALGRYGSEHLARKLAIVRQMHANLQAVEHHSEYRSDDAERPHSVIYLPT